MATLPKTPEILTKIRVHYFDTDAAGVVHNVAYLRFVEVARCDLAEALGWSLKEMAERGPVPVVVWTEIRYEKPARLGEVVQVVARLTSLERASFSVEFLILSEQGGRLAWCRQRLACVDLAAKKPARLPESWRKTYPELVGKPFRAHKEVVSDFPENPKV
jgi:acyl-CoA thioester hydrolase